MFMLRYVPLRSGLSLFTRITQVSICRLIRVASAMLLIALLPATPVAASGAACTSGSPAVTQLVYVGQATGHFSESLTLAALLTDASGVPLANRGVSFA